MSHHSIDNSVKILTQTQTKTHSVNVPLPTLEKVWSQKEARKRRSAVVALRSESDETMMCR